MPRIIRNTMLNYIPKALPEMKNPDMRRIFDFNNNEIKKGKIVYLCQREIRAKDNMALDFAKKLKRELNLPLRVIHRREHFLYKQKENFIEKQINITKEEFEKKEIEFEIFRGTKAALKEYLKEIQTSVLIIDFNPIENYEYLLDVPFKIFEIDGHNIIPSNIYSLNALEQANTHDPLWNSTQIELISKGTIHGYLRMYWAKKILQWSDSPKTALKNAIYLNDKYAYDSPSPSGYTGILWAIAALHDRAFRDYFITGKIRRMTYDSMKKKFDITKYINENKKRGML